MSQYILSLSSGIGAQAHSSPLFDSTNYAYQKVRMRDFLQSLDEKVWQIVEIG